MCILEGGRLAPVLRQEVQPKPALPVLYQDFHCHLTRSEVVGYLGGRWDINNQSGYWDWVAKGVSGAGLTGFLLGTLQC